MKAHKFFYLFTIAAVVSLIISCGGEPIRMTGNKAVDTLNLTLAKVPIEGFPSGKPASKEDWNRMINIAVPVVKEVMPKVPAGYNLQVTGHTDGEGGINSADNMKLSAERAQSVWAELRKKGINDPKLTYKGVAGTIKTGKCGINSSCQRRVTFMVVPK
jgi:outer membrane protein OmpA-like peptidoglycan-associated protein